MKVALKVIEGKPLGMEIPLKGPKFSIGRDPRCNLRPNSDLVSKTHCLIQVQGSKVLVSDLGSTNGTFVNGRQIKDATIIAHGDHIKVGPLVFSALIEAEQPVEAAKVATSSQAVEEDDPLQWLVGGEGDDSGAEPGPDSTVMDLPAAKSQEDTVPDQWPVAKPSQANGNAPKAKSGTSGTDSQKKDTREAAQEILNRYLVRRRTP